MENWGICVDSLCILRIEMRNDDDLYDHDILDDLDNEEKEWRNDEMSRSMETMSETIY